MSPPVSITLEEANLAIRGADAVSLESRTSKFRSGTYVQIERKDCKPRHFFIGYLHGERKLVVEEHNPC